MRVPWFNWRSLAREDDAFCVANDAPHERTADEVMLALRLMPLYQVRLQLDDATLEQRLWPPCDWRDPLTAALGEERARRALSDFAERGAAVIAICPRELAEHYRDELAQLALPCVIQPA